jgi:hypothetical protein
MEADWISGIGQVGIRCGPRHSASAFWAGAAAGADLDGFSKTTLHYTPSKGYRFMTGATLRAVCRIFDGNSGSLAGISPHPGRGRLISAAIFPYLDIFLI